MNGYKNINISVISLITIFLITSGCDFKPKWAPPTIKGTEPILRMDITGFEGKELHMEDINLDSRLKQSSSLDILASKSYISDNPFTIWKIYVTDVATYRDLTPQPGTYFYKPGPSGIDLSGDVSKGLSKSNIVLTEEDIQLGKSLDSIKLAGDYLSKLKADSPFDYYTYRSYKLKIFDTYLPYLVENLFDDINLRISILTNAAKNKLISQSQYSTIGSFNLNNDFHEEEDLNSIRGVLGWEPVLGLGEQLSSDYLSETYKLDLFFTKKIPETKIKILIDPDFQSEKDSNSLEARLKEKFQKQILIKVVELSKLFNYKSIFPTRFGSYEILFPKDKPILYSNYKTRRLIILDNQNRVLFNTEDNEHVMSQIEGILAVLPINEEVQ